MKLQISIDPSISHCGVVVWSEGVAIDWFTINVPAKIKGRIEKLAWLQTRFGQVFHDQVKRAGGALITSVAVEKFQGHTHLQRTLSMMACSEARATIVSVAHGFCDNVFEVSKGSMRKNEAISRSVSAGLGNNDHIADAYVIGLKAGFGHG